MTARSSDWRPSPTVCRCCFAEGCYKDISTEYFWMGKREVYSEMLSDTFDVSIAYSQSGGPNSHSRLICEPCISRLRDASDFKRQVQECERVFMQHLDPGSSSLQLESETEQPVTVKEVKIERVKKEQELTDDDDFGDMSGFPDDDDDDLDDQPLQTLASKVPKKESVELMELIENPKPVKRKSTRVKAVPVKKAKKSTPKASASKEEPKTEKKKKGSARKVEDVRNESKKIKKLFERSVNQNPQRQNAVLLIKFSTAIPFKTRFNRTYCSYCHDEFEQMSTLRTHVQTQHPSPDHNSVFYKVTDDLKVDITSLKCTECMQDIPNIDTLMTHLAKEHEKPVNFNVPFGVLPYKQGPNGAWMCLECDKTFSEFYGINGHLRTHVKIFTCDKCSATFLTDHGLRQHSRNFKCYNSSYKPRFGKASKHRNNTEIILECSTARPFRTWGQNFNCIFCRVQSYDPNGLREHMTTYHANYNIQHVFSRKIRKEFLKVDITDLQCKLCYKPIDSLDDLMKHLKNDHKQPINIDVQPGVLPFKLRDGSCWQCAICNIQFTEFNPLKQHTLEHYQNYVCDTCGEGFITELALTAHTKIPHDNKYSCSRCVATFTTLEERNIHLKTQHTNLPYMCNYCKEKPRFTTWELRKRHLMEFHNYTPGAEIYECTTCHMTFKSRSQKYHHNVKAHRTKKESDYGFPCFHCSRSFALKISLDKHVAKKHFHV